MTHACVCGSGQVIAMLHKNAECQLPWLKCTKNGPPFGNIFSLRSSYGHASPQSPDGLQVLFTQTIC